MIKLVFVLKLFFDKMATEGGYFYLWRLVLNSRWNPSENFAAEYRAEKYITIKISILELSSLWILSVRVAGGKVFRMEGAFLLDKYQNQLLFI